MNGKRPEAPAARPHLAAWKLPPIVAGIALPIVGGFYIGGPGLGMAVGALAAATIVVLAVRKPPLRAKDELRSFPATEVVLAGDGRGEEAQTAARALTDRLRVPLRQFGGEAEAPATPTTSAKRARLPHLVATAR